MSKLIFTLDRQWVEEKREKFSNPIRKMERFVKECEGVTLIKSDYASITVEVEETNRDAFAKKIGEYVKETFEESNPWQYVRVGGDTQNMNIPSEDTKEEKKQEKTPSISEKKTKEEVELEVAESEEKKREKSILADRTKLEEADFKVDTMAESISNGVPMKYSPELAAYITELGQVITMLKEMHANECIWSQNLLVSIDKGYGYTSFLRAIAKVYKDYEVAAAERLEDSVMEVVISNYKEPDKKYSDWKSALSRAQEMAAENRRGVKRIIFSMDISQWQSELCSPTILEYLRQINETAVNFICTFKVPFMEGQVLHNIEAALSDVMGIKTLTVAPISIENMMDYLKKEVGKMNCTITEECDDVLEQWIAQEKQDDSFFGYKTLDKMAKQLIYQKALLNCANGNVKKNIEVADINTLLNGPELLEEPYKLLNNLIGIAEVKQKLKEIVIQIKTQKELAQKGTNLEVPSIHMMFTGNPGTGKTTVARILARIMKEEKVLRKGHFHEVQGRNLCGRYVGETAPKTSTYCRDAYGSVLFIDEAYSLYQNEGERDFGKEAIQTLIAEMENHRDDFCVIMAGYTDEMNKLMEVNPGLESRIPYVIEFPNYSREELEQIFFKMLDGKIAYEESLKEEVKAFFAAIPDEVMESKEFSNARLVRNLFERAWGKAAYRRSLNGEEKLEIRKEDLLCASEENEFKRLMDNKGHKKIGF